MSGHSKWAQIRHKKALTDKKKGQIFSKLSKLITVSARNGTDPKTNPALAQVIERARAMNMPNENIDRAVKKISDRSNQLEELYIEALGPRGVALKIKAITDNKNRTMTEIKKILSDNGSKLAQPGSLSWMFASPIVDPDGSLLKDLEGLLDALDENDDVEDVSTNLNE